jgi:ABC-type antimicrobial peptide transport system permease subunit
MIPFYYNVRSLLVRRISTGATVFGLALVVFVFTAVLMLSNGIEDALRSGGRADNVVLLREGSTSEIVSALDRDTVRAISTYPEVAPANDGTPLAQGELVVLIALARREGGFVNATVRGVGPKSFALRPAVEIVEGRAPLPGTNEVVIGTALLGRSAGAFVGGELSFAGGRWPVVGRLRAARGAAYESELWCDADRLAQAFDRVGYSSAVVRLRHPELSARFMAEVAADARFTLKAAREDDYWASQATSTATFVRVLGLFVSIVFSAGAVTGAMITMYAQVAARARELAVMRAIGFRARSVLASVVVEAALLGVAGGVLGAVGAFLMRWVRIQTLNFQTFSEVRFRFVPTPLILLLAILFGVVMGTLGGLLPALRAARAPVLGAARR